MPRDLTVRWTHDSMVCETRPFVRTTSVPGIKWVGPSAGFLFFFVSPLPGMILTALWLVYVGVDWYRERLLVEQLQRIQLGADALVIIRERDGVELQRERIALRSIGLVSATQRLGAFELIVRRAGAPDLAIPINNESQTAGAWIAAAIQTAAKAARERDGDGPAEVPRSLREILGLT